MLELRLRKFLLLLIKPSHYSDEGYVIRWWRTTIPSNSLAAVYGIAADCAERRVLGPDVTIDIDAIDETNTRLDVPALLARFQRNGGLGLVALVGVQSNQYPRALDIARPFREAGVPVIMGGRFSAVAKRIGGKWLYVTDHASAEPPPAAAKP